MKPTKNRRENADGDVGFRENIAASDSRKEWYSRGYLPHRDATGLLQAVTFRLADSLPQEKLARLEEELTKLPRLCAGPSAANESSSGWMPEWVVAHSGIRKWRPKCRTRSHEHDPAPPPAATPTLPSRIKGGGLTHSHIL